MSKSIISDTNLHKNTIIGKEGIFGFGLSHNNNLDLLNIVVLACAGIIIKLFFQENYSKLGNIGPASSTIWGYGLTGVALSIMIFMGIYFSKNLFELQKGGNFFTELFSNVSPIFFTLLVIVYTIYLNFNFFTRINSNKVTPDYHTYSFMSSILIIIQIVLITKYLFSYLSNNKNDIPTELSKNATYVLSVVNFIFLLMIHISLAFFSTDESYSEND